MSLKGAIEELGFPCFHMIDLITGEDGDRELPYWIKIANNEPVDWDEVFEPWEATVDWPECSRWEQLIEAFRRPLCCSTSVTSTASVPSERLIVWELATDGWQPICEALVVEAPDKPVPPARHERVPDRVGLHPIPA
jgi:Sulfotransferase domain